MGLLNDIKNKKETISYNKSAIMGHKTRIKELQQNDKLMKGERELFIQTQKEMGENRIKENIKLEKEIEELENKFNEMLKYFKANKPPMQMGRIINLLDKTYNNPFKNEGLNGYSKKLYEIINFAIENNKQFYLQFKTLEKECLKVYDYDLKRWV